MVSGKWVDREGVGNIYTEFSWGEGGDVGCVGEEACSERGKGKWEIGDNEDAERGGAEGGHQCGVGYPA